MLPGSVTITKVGHQGQALISYPGELVYQDQDQLVARCLWTEDITLDLGGFLLEPGDIFVEHYFYDTWFNIFAVYDRLGRLKGWYCNITRPVEIVDREIRWRDLALDLLVLPGDHGKILDEDEFEALSLPEPIRQQARQALDTILDWVKEGRPPFGPNSQIR